MRFFEALRCPTSFDTVGLKSTQFREAGSAGPTSIEGVGYRFLRQPDSRLGSNPRHPDRMGLRRP